MAVIYKNYDINHDSSKKRVGSNIYGHLHGLISRALAKKIQGVLISYISVTKTLMSLEACKCKWFMRFNKKWQINKCPNTNNAREHFATTIKANL